MGLRRLIDAVVDAMHPRSSSSPLAQTIPSQRPACCDNAHETFFAAKFDDVDARTVDGHYACGQQELKRSANLADWTLSSLGGGFQDNAPDDGASENQPLDNVRPGSFDALADSPSLACGNLQPDCLSACSEEPPACALEAAACSKDSNDQGYPNTYDGFSKWLFEEKLKPTLFFAHLYAKAVQDTATYASEHELPRCTLYGDIDALALNLFVDTLLRDQDFIAYDKEWNGRHTEALALFAAFIGCGRKAGALTPAQKRQLKQAKPVETPVMAEQADEDAGACGAESDGLKDNQIPASDGAHFRGENAGDGEPALDGDVASAHFVTTPSPEPAPRPVVSMPSPVYADVVAPSGQSVTRSDARPHEDVRPAKEAPVASSVAVDLGVRRLSDAKNFERWLLAEGKVCQPKIAAAYSKAITTIEEMSSRFGLADCKLYGNFDPVDVARQAGSLTVNTVFKTYSNRWYGRPLRALDCFVDYTRAEFGATSRKSLASRRESSWVARTEGKPAPSVSIVSDCTGKPAAPAASPVMSAAVQDAPAIPMKEPAIAVDRLAAPMSTAAIPPVNPSVPNPTHVDPQGSAVRSFVRQALVGKSVADREEVPDGATEPPISTDWEKTSSQARLPHASFDLAKPYDRIAQLVMDKFPNGVRPGSIIDRNKIRRLYAERFDDGDSLDDTTIIDALHARALVHNDKAYVLSEEAKARLCARCEELVASGQRMFFYEELYRAHAEEYAQEKIFSSELLHAALESLGFRFAFCDTYFTTIRGITIEDELVRAFGNDAALSLEAIKERLRFIPEESLVPALARSGRFVSASSKEYAFLDKVMLDQQDITEAHRVISDAIARNGFAPLRIVDVGRTMGENPGLSEVAACNALYEKALARSFDRKGSLISRRGERISTKDVMRSWCLDHDELTLEEMDEYVEQDLCGQGAAQLLRTAFDVLVRVDADRFVADRFVDFDVSAADAALALFVGDGIVPVKSVTSFTSFPDAGRSWNLFLLESYVHRFSARYQIDGGPVRDANVGALYPKGMCFADYRDLLSHVLADSGAPLGDGAASDFLVEQGFVARRAKITREAAARARVLRDLQ